MTEQEYQKGQQNLNFKGKRFMGRPEQNVSERY
jgi:hypothetical protein